MALNRIEDADRLNKGVTGLSDTPNMEAAALQAKFDELGNMAIDAYNETVDTLNSTNGAVNVGATVPEGLNASNNTQSILNALARRTIHSEDLMHSHDNKLLLDSITETVKASYDKLVSMFGTIIGIQQNVTDSVAYIPTGHAIVNYVGRMGGGDMQMSTYDIDNDGIVDDSSALEGHPASYFATKEALDGKLDGEGLVSDYSQVAQGGTDTDVPSTSLIHQMIVNFQAGVDGIYNKLVSNGSTPASKELDDVTNAIDGIRADGNATAADISKGKTAWAGKTKITGTMASKATATYTPGSADQVISKGQYLSGDQVIKGDKNLISGNIKSGVSIFGIAGNSNVVNTSTGDATSAQILSGKKAYVKGALVTGSIASKGAATYTPTTKDQTIASGQYLSGVQTIKGDSNLSSGNIRSGATIFGISGNSNVVNTSGANAAAAQILTGYSGYVKGSLVSGNMANRGAVSQSIAPGGSYTIPAGYHNGSGKVTAKSGGNAAAGEILSGKTAYVGSTLVTGTMTNRGAVSATVAAGGTYTIPAGYHNGSGKVTAGTKSLKIVKVGSYDSGDSSKRSFNVATYVSKGCSINNFALRNVKQLDWYSSPSDSYYGDGTITMTLSGNTLSIAGWKGADRDLDGDLRNHYITADVYVYYVE